MKSSTKYDVVSLGELLIDFTNNGISNQGNMLFEANPGGAPCNVLSMLQNLGAKTAFIGKVGQDMFGKLLRSAIENVGIDSTYLYEDKSVNTTLAFVHTFEDGDRDFSFYRNPGADMMLSVEDVLSAREAIENTKIFHFGSLSLTHDINREATYKAIEIAKEAGAVISYDPNLREPLWNSLDEAIELISWGLSQCDVLKISDNEISLITGTCDYNEAIVKIKEMYPNIELVFVSLGKDGSLAYNGDVVVSSEAFILPDTIETTGAGDTFMACCLYQILESKWRHYNPMELNNMIKFSNAAAAIITTRKGALSVMPTLDEIYSLNRGR